MAIFVLDFMVEGNSIEDSMECIEAFNLNATSLNDQQHFRLNKIDEIKHYFIAEIKERELMSKRLSKYIASFDYFDKSLIILSATGISYMMQQHKFFHHLLQLLEHL